MRLVAGQRVVDLLVFKVPLLKILASLSLPNDTAWPLNQNQAGFEAIVLLGCANPPPPGMPKAGIDYTPVKLLLGDVNTSYASRHSPLATKYCCPHLVKSSPFTKLYLITYN